MTAIDYNFLLATTGSAVLDLGNSTPDTDGDFLLVAAMFSFVSIIGANGDGVLARVTLEAIGSGSSALDLTSVKLSDTDGNPIPPTDANNFYIGPVNDASIVVDSPCDAVDSDGDTVPDDSDNCPAWPNPDQSLPPWPIPPDDPDCDGFTTDDENSMGTLPLDACPATLAFNDEEPDAWSPDFNDDRAVNIIDIGGLRPVFGSTDGDGRYVARKDLNTDGFINIIDVGALRPYFLETCIP